MPGHGQPPDLLNEQDAAPHSAAVDARFEDVDIGVRGGQVPGDDGCGGLERKRTKGVQNFTLGFLARRGPVLGMIVVWE